jgi:tetratricopeptide (TPR) repeat protein
MLRKVLVYGLICVVVAVGAVAYIAGIGPGELAAPSPTVAGKKYEPLPRPAFVDMELATLEAPIESAITADLPAITELQASRRWVQELEPLIPTKDLVLWKDAFEEYVDYRKRVVEAYRKGTRDPQAAQAAAVTFLENYSHAAAWQRGDWKAIREQGDAAVSAGSTDPVVLAYHSRSKLNLNEIQQDEAFETYKKLKDQLGEAAYPPPILRFLLTAWSAELAQKLNRAEAPAHPMRQIAFGEAATFLAKESGSANPAVLLSLVKNVLRFGNGSSEQRLELFQACLMEPNIDPYIVHMLGGEYYLNQAWNYRGGGFANTVSKDGWKKFGELMPRAARHYRRAWFLHPELPFAAEEMIMVSTADGDDSWKPADWFHASVVAQFDYHEAYRSYMFVSLPRWGGSLQKVANIASECIATGRWDTAVPSEAATAVRLIAEENVIQELVGTNPAAEQIATAYIDGFAAAKERGEVKPEDYAETLAEMTATLVQAGNFPQARKAFDIGPESNDWWWSIERGVGYRYSMGLSYAITGPAEKFVKTIHEFLTREAVEAPSVGEVEEMQKRLDDARAADSNPKAAEFYDIASRMLGQLKSYAAGEWVELTFEPQMALWMSRAGKYDIIDPVTIRVTATEQLPHMRLKPLVRFAPPYMVEAEVKFVPAAGGDGFPGIVIGAGQVRLPDQTPRPQVLSAGPRITAYFDYLQHQGKPSAAEFDPEPVPEDGFLHLGIRRYPDETQMFAMHGRFLTDRNNEPVNDFILFGDTKHFGVTGEATFRNLRIRKAPPKVPGLNSERADSLPAYFSAVEYYPECPEARRMLAAALAAQGRETEALEHIAKAKAVYPKISDINRIEGVARCGMGEFDGALAAFRRDVVVFPASLWSPVHEAWVLATAPDDKLRDGRKAQELLESARPRMGDRAEAWSIRVTEAVVAAENGKLDEAKEFARQAEDATDSDNRRAFAQRVRSVIEEGRAYRMPATGEVPPLPANAKRKPEAAKDTEAKSKSQ